MKRTHAKTAGYEVIDEFERNIIRRVHVRKDGQEVKRVY